jgi:hypothetical protein
MSAIGYVEPSSAWAPGRVAAARRSVAALAGSSGALVGAGPAEDSRPGFPEDL